MRRFRSSLGVLAATGALVAPATAAADNPPPPTPTPAPAPQAGRAKFDTAGVRLHGRVYVLTGARVTLTGAVKPYVAGQFLSVRISSPHRKPARARAKIGKGGAFKVIFHTRRAVAYKVLVRHAATDQQLAFSAHASVQALAASGAGPGSHGIAIALLKQGLRGLGYPAGSGPTWTDKLGRELMAFRKVNGMARVFTADRALFRMVFAGKGGFVLRHPRAGKHAEFDWSRQVLVLADGDKVKAVYHASSGKPSTPTVFGTFHFYLKAPGTNAKGMFMSNYFTGNYAVHGYPDVPPYAASHGCIRVPNADALAIWAQISIGEPIFIYL